MLELKSPWTRDICLGCSRAFEPLKPRYNSARFTNSLCHHCQNKIDKEGSSQKSFTMLKY